LSLLPGLASGARGPGALDPTFGAGGKVRTDFGQFESIDDHAVQRDGKIVVVGTTANKTTFAGSFAVARYTRHGSLDTSFGAGGRVTTDFGGTTSFARAVAVQGNGRIVAAGGSGGDIALARYNVDGSLDPAFGVGGKVRTDFGQAEWIEDLAVQRDGKLVVVGSTRPFGPFVACDFALARYNPDGSLDASFDGDGTVVSAPSSDNGAFDVVVQPDRRVVVAGFVEFDLALVRYSPAGGLDSTFGQGGVATPSGRDGSAQALVRQSDGKLVAAGATVSGSSSDPNAVAFAVARFESSGRPDASFRDGLVSTDFGANDQARGLAIQADGKIVAGGSSAQFSSEGILTEEDFAVARYVGKPAPCKVPNVRGKKLGAARSAITKARCRVGTVTRRPSQTVKRGRVISQNPKAGRRLANRGRVNLVVSRGQK
jgi:uncharacterized delta-60 repeat protein